VLLWHVAFLGHSAPLTFSLSAGPAVSTGDAVADVILVMQLNDDWTITGFHLHRFDQLHLGWVHQME